MTGSADYKLPPSAEDIEAFDGPYGYAVVRKPSSSTAPKAIGNPEGKMFGFTRVVFVLKGHGPDVYQVKDDAEGREVAKTLVAHGDLQGLKPNGGGRYKV
ncbi:MAG: hypothetical protein ACYDCK_12455 [Thermoplasmatota archaeon]